MRILHVDITCLISICEKVNENKGYLPLHRAVSRCVSPCVPRDRRVRGGPVVDTHGLDQHWLMVWTEVSSGADRHAYLLPTGEWLSLFTPPLGVSVRTCDVRVTQRSRLTRYMFENSPMAISIPPDTSLPAACVLVWSARGVPPCSRCRGLRRSLSHGSAGSSPEQASVCLSQARPAPRWYDHGGKGVEGALRAI